MFERFTDRVRRVLVMAQDECQQLGSDALGPAHLLLGLSRDTGGAASAALRSVGANHDSLRGQLSAPKEAASTQGSGQRPFSPEGKRVLELALREALQMGDAGIGTIALLLGVVRVADAQVGRALKALGTDLDRLREAAEEMKMLEAGELAEVAVQLTAESEDHASAVYDDPTDRLIAAFEGPIFAILAPDLGPPSAGGSSAGGNDLTQIGVQYDDVTGSTWQRVAYIETTFRDRIQGAVFLGGNPTPEEREQRLKEFMVQQRRDDLAQPPARRFREILDYAFYDEHGNRPAVVDVIPTGSFELRIEGIPTAVETWSAGSWSLGSFEGEFKGRLVGVKLGINGVQVSDCAIGFVTDPGTLADT